MVPCGMLLAALLCSLASWTALGSLLFSNFFLSCSLFCCHVASLPEAFYFGNASDYFSTAQDNLEVVDDGKKVSLPFLCIFVS